MTWNHDDSATRPESGFLARKLARAQSILATYGFRPFEVYRRYALPGRQAGVASGGAVGCAARSEVRHPPRPAAGAAALHLHPLWLPWRLLRLRRVLLLLLWWGLPHGWGLLTHGTLVRLLIQLRRRCLLRWRWGGATNQVPCQPLPLEPRKLLLVRGRVRLG